MADGGFLALLGLDAQLLVAGSLGGVVQSIIGKQQIKEAVGTMVVGGVLGNYFSAAGVALADSGLLFGVKLQAGNLAAACAIGVFSTILIGFAGAFLRSKLEAGK